MIEVRDLSFSYGKHQVLDHLNFSLGSGELIAVLGANGAGKSTMFRCLLGLMKQYTGEIRMNGRDILRLTRREIAEYAAYIPQAEAPVFNYSVLDTALMGTTGTLSLVQSPGEEQLATAREALATLGIAGLAERGVQEISGGERQLAFLARALAQRAQMLVMDEPTANLDYGNQQLVMRHVKSLADAGYTVLVSTHNPEHALQYATKVLILKDRRLFAYGDTDDVLTEAAIREIYGLSVVIANIEVEGRVVRSCVPAP